ncbi:MAG: single-stranded DNA-binding protein [Candidatus Omnitrophica bacterium]|nr:single-stranded DNA-binding protein [Candidatus Omnitrophota bacterium]
MPASLNRVLMIGNLTRDPEMRYIPSGQPVATFSVALNRNYQSPSGEKKEEVSFIRVVCWARLAEICNQYLKKGSSVFVEGRLQSRSWEAQDGTKKSTVEVVASSVQFLSTKGASKQNEGAAQEGEAVIEDSFAPGAPGPQAGMKISENELEPDEQVPF